MYRQMQGLLVEFTGIRAIFMFYTLQVNMEPLHVLTIFRLLANDLSNLVSYVIALS